MVYTFPPKYHRPPFQAGKSAWITCWPTSTPGLALHTLHKWTPFVQAGSYPTWQSRAEIWSLWTVQESKKNLKKSHRSRTKLLGMGRRKKKPQMSVVKYSVVVGSSRDVQPMILWLKREQRRWVGAGCHRILEWEKLSWAQVSLGMTPYYIGVCIHEERIRYL